MNRNTHLHFCAMLNCTMLTKQVSNIQVLLGKHSLQWCTVVAVLGIRICTILEENLNNALIHGPVQQSLIILCFGIYICAMVKEHLSNC